MALAHGAADAPPSYGTVFRQGQTVEVEDPLGIFAAERPKYGKEAGRGGRGKQRGKTQTRAAALSMQEMAE